MIVFLANAFLGVLSIFPFLILNKDNFNFNVFLNINYNIITLSIIDDILFPEYRYIYNNLGDNSEKNVLT